MNERRILGIPLPNLLPGGDFSVFNRHIETISKPVSQTDEVSAKEAWFEGDANTLESSNINTEIKKTDKDVKTSFIDTK